jgi:hypothetical protein
MNCISPGLLEILTKLHARQEVALRNHRRHPMTLKEALQIVSGRALGACPNLKELTELVEHAGEDELVITVLYFNGKNLDSTDMHPDVAEALEQIDAAMFTGNPADTFKDFTTLAKYIARWSRCMKETRETMHKDLDDRPRKEADPS